MINIISQELSALSEIYSELHYQQSDFDNSIRGSFEADMKLDNVKEVIIKDNEKSFLIKHFPTIKITFWLAEDADIVSFNVDSMWLTTDIKNKLREKLSTFVLDDEGVLWRWFQFLELESFTYLFNEDMKNSIELDINQLNKAGHDELYDLLNEYDNKKMISVFNDSIIDCGSCMVSKRGRDCILTRRCGDVFCLQCASHYFNTQIKNGDLHLRCLICSGDVDYDEIKCILDKESFDRWDQLVFNNYLKTNGVAKPCRRCSTISPVEDNCGICPKCHYVFCANCNETYSAGHDCEKERKRRVNENEFVEFRKQHPNAVPCPKCSIIYDKIEGCNKMTCPVCKTFFCYLCKTELSKTNPYAHFGLYPGCYL